MKTINEINSENFERMFNIRDILENSVFYPASGTDGSAMACFSEQFSSFIQVDYSVPKQVIEQGMKHHFARVGYDLIGIKNISREELITEDSLSQHSPINAHKKSRLEIGFINKRFNCINFTPFALWAVYELNPSKTGKTTGKAKRFSFLHIGGEACATFENLYLRNKINPAAIAIISPGEGFGDNWTTFRDPDFRLHQNLRYNFEKHNTPMPRFLLTNILDDNAPCFWPDYHFSKNFYTGEWQRLYERT